MTRESKRALSAALQAHDNPTTVDDSLVHAFERFAESGRNAWRDIDLSFETLADAVVRSVPEGAQVLDVLAKVHPTDFYLAVACVRADSLAIEQLETLYLTRVRAIVAKIGAKGTAVDDVMQRLRTHLLVGLGSRGPALRGYRGKSDLHAWLRVVAVREANHLLRSDRHVARPSDEVEALLAPSTAPDLDLMRDHYREEFRHAFRVALASLDERQRNLLRYHLMDRLSIDQIASIYNIHRATAARWLVRVRERLYQATRQELTSRMSIKDDEFESIIHLIQSRLDASFAGVLAVE